ncbi:hypothetical protein E8E11_011439 [Didymella keratinophila]|nr:hypothetical protein E8E11_011439 [Didymella keratinophila]
MILTKTRPSLYIPACAMIWSCVSAATAGVHNYQGLIAWLFIIEGAATFVCALGSMFVLPDFPGSKTGGGKWLFNKEEQKLAIDRIQRDRVPAPEANERLMHGLKLAVTDYRTWVFSLMLFANHSAYGFNNFLYNPTIVKDFGLGSRTITLVCPAPPYLIGTLVSFAIEFSSGRNKERGFHISIPLCVAVAGFIITVATLNVPTRYFTYFFYIGGCFGSNAIVYTWAASTLNATPAKRACGTTIVNIMSQMGNIYSPCFFRSQDAPRYIRAMLPMMGVSTVSICTCIFMKTSLRRANKKLLKKEEDTGVQQTLFPL